MAYFNIKGRLKAQYGCRPFKKKKNNAQPENNKERLYYLACKSHLNVMVMLAFICLNLTGTSLSLTLLIYSASASWSIFHIFFLESKILRSWYIGIWFVRKCKTYLVSSQFSELIYCLYALVLQICGRL